MHPLSYLFLEISTVALFALTLWHATKRGNWQLGLLVSAAVYGVLLEWGNIVIFRTYHYSSQFWLAVGPVPIVIGLCWGMIIYGAMAYSDQLGLPAWVAPFADALWAIMLDLAFDTIAIRLELWTWSNPLATGYYGVPADNFFAWLFVAFAFSAFIRWARSRSRVWSIQIVMLSLAPVVSFIGLLIGIQLYKVLVAILYPAGVPIGGSMPVFAGALALFATIVGVVVWRRGVQARHGIDIIPVITRLAMHGYFLIWALLLAVAPALRLPGMDMPKFLIGVAVVLLAMELVLLVPVVQRNIALRRQIVVVPQREQDGQSGRQVVSNRFHRGKVVGG
jgi:hypothetical protein